ncbi:MAG: HEAT repeat domain-containing protein [Planctomycetes bacterium]|nr:HEAT repeat domain-containing protein [Planctomycetota bacterium]
MALSDTFACLPELPAPVQLALCRAALSEPNAELQIAAMGPLIDPERLARPDLVVGQFGALLPGAVEAAKAWREPLLAIAGARIRGDGGAERGGERSDAVAGRLPAFRAVAALAGLDGVDILLLGLQDGMREIRAVAFTGIEQRVRLLATELRRAGQNPTLRDDIDRAVWSTFQRCVGDYPDHQRIAFLELLPEFGERSVAIVAKVLKGPDAKAFVEPLIGALLHSRAPLCVDLVLALAAHRSAAVSRVGKQVLQGRGDESFRATLAERMVGLAERRVMAMEDDMFAETLIDAVPRLDPDAAASLLDSAVAQAVDGGEGQSRAEAFLGHPASVVQLRAIAALRQLGCPNGCDALGPVIAGAADDVRLAAAQLVVELQPENSAALLTPLLGSSDPEARRLAIREVSQVSLARFLDRFDGMDQRARELAASALSKIDGRLIERLAGEFGSFDARRRVKALQVVGLLDAGAELRAPLLELLEDADVRVRATAVRLVQVTGSVDGLKVLIDALSDPDRRVRANAIEAFEQLDDPRHTELLTPFLRDRDNRVRANAAKALWNLGWPEARDVLVGMLKDDDARMRLSAIWAIQEVRFHGARELLQSRDAAERDPAVRARLREAIAAIENTATVHNPEEVR